MNARPPNATVCGSFRRAMSAVQDAVYSLTDAGARVLSPADPRVVDQFGDFLFVASDRVRAIKLVQSRHLAAIEASDFVWLVAPDGYIGQSGAMEIGYAVAVGTPIFSSEVPVDLTLRQYVSPLHAPEDALREIQRPLAERRAGRSASVLLEPEGVLQTAHDDLERIAVELSHPGAAPVSPANETAVGRLLAGIAQPLRSR